MTGSEQGLTAYGALYFALVTTTGLAYVLPHVPGTAQKSTIQMIAVILTVAVVLASFPWYSGRAEVVK